MLITVYTTV